MFCSGPLSILHRHHYCVLESDVIHVLFATNSYLVSFCPALPIFGRPALSCSIALIIIAQASSGL